MKPPVFINALVFVADLEAAKRFYCDLLGQRVAQSEGDFVQLENGLALHTGRALEKTVFGHVAADNSRYGRRNLILYLETEDIDGMFDQVAAVVDLIHPIVTQAWGQRVFRFHDPDGHIIEIGEPM